MLNTAKVFIDLLQCQITPQVLRRCLLVLSQMGQSRHCDNFDIILCHRRYSQEDAFYRRATHTDKRTNEAKINNVMLIWQKYVQTHQADAECRILV